MSQQSPSELATLLRNMAATGDGARQAAQLMAAADQLDCLQSIHTELDGQEWSSDTANAVAAHLNDSGLTVRDICDDE